MNAPDAFSGLSALIGHTGFVGSATQFHHRETTYQYYAIDRLWQDIAIAGQAGLTHLHLAPEPLRAADIHAALTGRPMPETRARLHREDMRTAHAALWGAHGPYQFAAADFANPADIRALQACLAATPGARVLVIGDDTLAARAGAEARIAAMMVPRNIAEGRLDAAGAHAFAARFGVTHILAADPALAGWADATFQATPVPGCPLALARLAP